MSCQGGSLVEEEQFSLFITCVLCSDGKPNTPTIVHVGRLGVEKNLEFLVE